MKFETGITLEFISDVATSEQIDMINIKYIIHNEVNHQCNKSDKFRQLSNEGVKGDKQVYYLSYDRIKKIYYDIEKILKDKL